MIPPRRGWRRRWRRPPASELGRLGRFGDGLLVGRVDLEDVDDRAALVHEEARQGWVGEVAGGDDEFLVLHGELRHQLPAQRDGVGLGRHQVRVEVVGTERLLGRRAHAGEARAADRADVGKAHEEAVEETAHAIGAGEDNPVVLADRVEDIGQGVLIRLKGDLE